MMENKAFVQVHVPYIEMLIFAYPVMLPLRHLCIQKTAKLY